MDNNIFSLIGCFLSTVCAIIFFIAGWIMISIECFTYFSIIAVLFVVSVICIIGNVKTLNFHR
jgi:hypothetical protein